MKTDCIRFTGLSRDFTSIYELHNVFGSQTILAIKYIESIGGKFVATEALIGVSHILIDYSEE